MIIIRRKPPRTFKLGDFVKHPVHGAGIVDAVAKVGEPTYFVSKWNGRGAPPAFYAADRYAAKARDLEPGEVPRPVVIRRR